MNSLERRNRIVDLINKNSEVLVNELSALFSISEVTIRADLRLLEEKGLVTRFHGGATKPLSRKLDESSSEVMLEDRYNQAEEAKRRIAILAASFVKKDDTVILDSGSTTLLIAEELVKTGSITVITNNLAAAFVLSENKDITLFVCGGIVRHKTKSMHGVVTERSLAGISADIMFLGADGIDPEKGITTLNEGYAISSVMAKCAKRIIATIDSSKFGRRGFNLVLPIDQLDIIITDTGISEESRKAFASTHAEILIA